jgi:lipopolysaccharide transport system ATP-binding protein
LKNASVIFEIRKGPFAHEHFPALSGINLDVIKGETLGVIGDNGSGKSTLLRLMAGIYQPDAGTIARTTSQVSLLSLALGFDPKLSGFDNAILSSMLLGASRKEALGKLNQIIEFSELREFIHKQVRTYSSGMRARLGFSVALTMNTDVLLIDEALAVGDAGFKKKCEAAIMEKLSSSLTVVLVSHSTAQVKKLCDRVICLNHGRIAAEGKPTEVVAQYEKNANEIPHGKMGRNNR